VFNGTLGIVGSFIRSKRHFKTSATLREHFFSGIGQEVRRVSSFHSTPKLTAMVDAKSGIPNSPVFNSSTKYGLGSLGVAANSYSVTDGAFGSTIRAYPSPHTVQRNYTNYVSIPNAICYACSSFR
jgi:hypothetical protein